MTNFTYNNMPFGQCPHCGYKWQIDEYYDLESGDTLECPECEKEIYLSDKDITISFRFDVNKD